jgi:hypothetical protein
MATDPRIRAADADRDRAAEALREHHAAGRLSIEEFQERLDRVYEAKTLGELDALMSDLPAIDLYQLPIPAGQRFIPPRPPAPRSHGRMSPAWRAAWAGWASVSLLCVVIWLITVGVSSGGTAYLWPVWVAGPLGAVLLARWVFGAAPGGGHGPASGRVRPASGRGRDEWRAKRRELRDDLRAQRRELRDHRGDQTGDR